MMWSPSAQRPPDACSTSSTVRSRPSTRRRHRCCRSGPRPVLRRPRPDPSTAVYQRRAGSHRRLHASALEVALEVVQVPGIRAHRRRLDTVVETVRGEGPPRPRRWTIRRAAAGSCRSRCASCRCSWLREEIAHALRQKGAERDLERLREPAATGAATGRGVPVDPVVVADPHGVGIALGAPSVAEIAVEVLLRGSSVQPGYDGIRGSRASSRTRRASP